MSVFFRLLGRYFRHSSSGQNVFFPALRSRVQRTSEQRASGTLCKTGTVGLQNLWLVAAGPDVVHRGLRPRDIQVNETGLVATLTRSKTLGADKSAMSRPPVLDVTCYVSENSRLITGWSLLKEAADFSCDFPLPSPSPRMLSIGTAL